MVVFIPKPKPDQVIRHEIVLGRSERELISDGLLAYQFNRVSTPLVALLSDVSAMGLILGALGTYYGFKFEIIPGAYDTGLELLNDFRTQLEAYRQSAENLADDPLGSLWAAINPFISNFNPGGRIDPVTGIPVEYPYGPTTPPDWTPGTPRPY